VAPTKEESGGAGCLLAKRRHAPRGGWGRLFVPARMSSDGRRGSGRGAARLL